MEHTHSNRSLKRKESSSSKGSENFKVAVRVRPLIVHEMKDNVNQVSRRCHCGELASDGVHEVHAYSIPLLHVTYTNAQSVWMWMMNIRQ